MSVQEVVVAVLAPLVALAAGRLAAQHRGLVLPMFPSRFGARARRLLRIHSYLPRWRAFAVLVGGWFLGAGVVFGITALPEHEILLAVVIPLVFLLGSVFLVVAFEVHRRTRTKEQKRFQVRRDEWARAVFAALPSTAQPYSLWLRPFTSTGQVWVVRRSRVVKLRHEDVEKAGFHVEFDDLETLLAAALEPVAPLIALGRTDGHVGAGRIVSTNSGWREDFLRLASSARTVFLLLSAHPGTNWETHWLLEHPAVLRRCVFVLPPAYDIDEKRRASLMEPGSTRPGNQDRTLDTVRAETLAAFTAFLTPTDRTRLAQATGGALFQLDNTDAVSVTRFVPLRVAGWWLSYWSGPRFVQSALRRAVAELNAR
jgi:hypothetical protein